MASEPVVLTLPPLETKAKSAEPKAAAVETVKMSGNWNGNGHTMRTRVA